MKIKKLIASVLSVTAAVGMMGFSAMASGMETYVPSIGADTTNITVNGNAEQYKAWRLMDVKQTLKGTCSHAEGEHTADCYNWNYTENEKYTTVITAAKQAAAGVTPPMTKFLSYPTDEFLREMQSTNTEAFEKKAWESLKTMEADAVSTTGVFHLWETSGVFRYKDPGNGTGRYGAPYYRPGKRARDPYHLHTYRG